MATGVQNLQAPRANAKRFCPYHGGFVQLADCPIVATSERFNSTAGAAPWNQPSAAPAEDAGGVDFDFDDTTGDTDEEPPRPPRRTPNANGERTKKRMVAEVVQAGRLWRSRVDDNQRLILAEAPGYERRLVRSTPQLASAAELARNSAGPSARPARACPRCRHPLPATIDYRNAYPIALVGYAEASKTSTVLALIEEAEQRGATEFGVDRLTPTEETIRYLQVQDKEIFDKFRANESLGRTHAHHHPPLEFMTTLGRGGAPVSMLIHDVSGEDLKDRDIRLERVPTVLWADAIIFIYNPEHSPALNTERGRPGQANILNGIRDDLEARALRDDTGRAYVEPPLIVAVSKADLLSKSYDIRGRGYTDQDVQNALRELRDGGVINAAARFPRVHWRFIAPMPASGGGPQGVVDLFSTVLSQLRR